MSYPRYFIRESEAPPDHRRRQYKIATVYDGITREALHSAYVYRNPLDSNKQPPGEWPEHSAADVLNTELSIIKHWVEGRELMGAKLLPPDPDTCLEIKTVYVPGFPQRVKEYRWSLLYALESPRIESPDPWKRKAEATDNFRKVCVAACAIGEVLKQ